VPQEAVDAARGEAFDVAILDVRMPGMDGFDVMAALKALQPELDVILMTGSVHEADARLIRAIRERAFFFLTKPFDRDVLLALVSRCLELRRANAENRLHVERLELELRAAQRSRRASCPRIASGTAAWRSQRGICRGRSSAATSTTAHPRARMAPCSSSSTCRVTAPRRRC
jgi:DNA-binding NtrC family response regulator